MTLIGYVVVELVEDKRPDHGPAAWDFPLGGDILFELDDRESADEMARSIDGHVAEVVLP